jgi:hypothetical protein
VLIEFRFEAVERFLHYNVFSSWYSYFRDCQVKVVPVHIMKAYWGVGGGLDLNILNLVIR